MSAPEPLPIGLMTEHWIKDRSVSEELKDQWIRNGYSILRGAYSPQQIAHYNEIVVKARSEVDDGKDEHGFGDRIGQLHQKHPEVLELATSPEVLSFLIWAFGDDPIVFGSLNFARGTTQDAHIDAIFFWPEPSYTMAGCWIALEDIHPDSGPLFYVPNSHTWPFYRSEHVVASRPELAERRHAARDPAFPGASRSALVSELGRAWTEDFQSLERQHKTDRVPLSIKAGDVVFWHSLLAHGGSPRINPTLSRRSVVFHFIGRSTKLYTFEQFMLYDREQVLSQSPQACHLDDYRARVKYMRYPYFVTYPKGGEKINPI
jgi:ectoine hydroxylase-related dioxygenase (phytanoyl-CoA dioxygenase family)